ncbi:MAG: hypothetical protein QOH29_312, partial [Actinomycetota bacterium]|nr:hypothetical protein [Actinomycetota bacterium]
MPTRSAEGGDGRVVADQTAIDRDDLASDEFGLVGGKKCSHIRDV